MVVVIKCEGTVLEGVVKEAVCFMLNSKEIVKYREIRAQMSEKIGEMGVQIKEMMGKLKETSGS